MTSAPAARQADPADISGLLARVARGDQPAFVELYHRTAAQVLGLAALMLGDTAAAEDITVAVYQQLWQTAAGYDPARGGGHAWLMNVAHRHAAAYLRAHRGPGTSPAGNAAAQLAALPPIPVPALGCLDAPARELVLLVYYRGYTTAQAASLLGLPPGTAGHRLRAALCALSAEPLASHGTVP